MISLTAYCGIDCASCQLYKASVNRDDSLKKEVAGKWGKIYKRTFDIAQMECLGCKSEKVFMLCSKCGIKACNKNKGIENCSRCPDYPCSRIEEFYRWQDIQDTEVTIIRR